MKARPIKRVNQEFVDCEIDEAEYLELRFPCVLEKRIIPIVLQGKREGTKNWTWNGNVEYPTLKPSILTRVDHVVCHSFVNDGIVEFLNDSTHSAVGTKLPLLEFE